MWLIIVYSIFKTTQQKNQVVSNRETELVIQLPPVINAFLRKAFMETCPINLSINPFFRLRYIFGITQESVLKFETVDFKLNTVFLNAFVKLSKKPRTKLHINLKKSIWN